MKRVSTTLIALPPTDVGAVGKAWHEVSASFDRFCLAAGIDALGAMMEKDAEEVCGARHARSEGRRGHRWGRTQGKIGFHAGKVTVERPRVRGLAGQELALPSWDGAIAEDWLGKWAMNLMLINVSTRKFRRAVRLPEGDVPAPTGAGVSKSAASRHFVALSAARMKEWMGADLSGLDIMVVQIDGIHIPPVFDHHIAPLDKPCCFKAGTKCRHKVGSAFGRLLMQKSDDRHRVLLRARRARQCRSARQSFDELPASHSIILSAVARRVSRTLKPSALAVLRLMTSSNLVGSRTGRSAGRSPLRMRPT